MFRFSDGCFGGPSYTLLCNRSYTSSLRHGFCTMYVSSNFSEIKWKSLQREIKTSEYCRRADAKLHIILFFPSARLDCKYFPDKYTKKKSLCFTQVDLSKVTETTFVISYSIKYFGACHTSLKQWKGSFRTSGSHFDNFCAKTVLRQRNVY